MNQGRIDTSQSRIDTSQSRIDTSQSRIDASQSRIDTSQSQTDTSQRRIDTSQRRIDTSQSRIDTSQRRIDTSQSRIDTSQSRIDRDQTRIETNVLLENTVIIIFRIYHWEIKLISSRRFQISSISKHSRLKSNRKEFYLFSPTLSSNCGLTSEIRTTKLQAEILLGGKQKRIR